MNAKEKMEPLNIPATPRAELLAGNCLIPTGKAF